MVDERKVWVMPGVLGGEYVIWDGGDRPVAARIEGFERARAFALRHAKEIGGRYVPEQWRVGTLDGDLRGSR